MPRNIELKLRVDSIEALLPVAMALAGDVVECIDQDDQFFAAPHGRLKLRRLGDGSAELIHYQRKDSTAARASDYVRVPVGDGDALAHALGRALGNLGRVRKRRWLLIDGATRIHLDRVERLGDFVELEVVLDEGQSDEQGRLRAESLIDRLGLARAPRVAVAYHDLLALGSEA